MYLPQVERDEPALVSLRGRRSVMYKIEAHFRFLAADSTHLLRGARPSYREVLLNVRDKCVGRGRRRGAWDPGRAPNVDECPPKNT